MTLAAVSMSTDFAYIPTNQQTVAVFIGFILFHGLLNTLNTAWLARITGVLPLRKFLRVVLRLPQYWVDACSHYRLVRRSKGQERRPHSLCRNCQRHWLEQ